MPNYRNPNGYGSVVRLGGNRRKPFAVRRTVGYDDRAFPIYQIIGYYATRTDAMMALADYNHDPYDIDLSKCTFKELYERFAADVYPKLGYSLVGAHKASYKHCKLLYDMPYKMIRKPHMQRCIDECKLSYATKANIRNFLIQLDKYAFDMEVVTKMRASNLRVSDPKIAKAKAIFSNAEVKTLWDHAGEPPVDECLYMLYTGCRMTEMLTTECANVNLTDGTITCGIKTEAGRNRVIPIHPKLRPIIERHLSDEKFLFPSYASKKKVANEERAAAASFSRAFAILMGNLGFHHTTHECRHTFRSKLDSAGANKVSIDLIMGHKSGDIGERVYTHKTLDELRSAIELLSYDA